MSKTSISGVLWGQSYTNGITAADLQEAKGFATGTGCEPPTGIIKPVISDERRAADMLARGIARSRRSNSEGFGE